MQPIAENCPGSWSVGGPAAGQPEYLPLEVTRGEEGALWSQWRPSAADMEALRLGAPIRVGLLAQRQPAIIVEVGEAQKLQPPGDPEGWDDPSVPLLKVERDPGTKDTQSTGRPSLWRRFTWAVRAWWVDLHLLALERPFRVFLSDAQLFEVARDVVHDVRHILHCPEGESILLHCVLVAERLKLGPPARKLRTRIPGN